jgi:hypothetical protein
MDIKGGAAIIKPLKNKREKRTVPSISKPLEKKRDVYSKASLQPDNLLLPHGQLLRGVPVQGAGEYKVPLATDVHSFAIRRRAKN